MPFKLLFYAKVNYTPEQLAEKKAKRKQQLKENQIRWRASLTDEQKGAQRAKTRIAAIPDTEKASIREKNRQKRAKQVAKWSPEKKDDYNKTRRDVYHGSPDKKAATLERVKRYAKSRTKEQRQQTYRNRTRIVRDTSTTVKPRKRAFRKPDTISSVENHYKVNAVDHEGKRHYLLFKDKDSDGLTKWNFAKTHDTDGNHLGKHTTSHTINHYHLNKYNEHDLPQTNANDHHWVTRESLPHTKNIHSAVHHYFDHVKPTKTINKKSRLTLY